MSPLSLPFLLFLSTLLLPFTFSTTYTTFLQCLSTQTNSPSISSIVFPPQNPSYPSVLDAYIKNRRFNTTTTTKPTLIVTPSAVSHVQAAVVCAKSEGLWLKIRSGGHDYEGISYRSLGNAPFVVLDMFNLRNISVDVANETAYVQAGANLGELYYRIAEKSNVLGFPAGVCPTVGVGGHLSGGGYGNMLRKFGLSVDHIIDAQIVDASGRLLDRKGMGEDLFWAIRGGGGGSFGVIVSYTVNLVSVPETVTVFTVMNYLDANTNMTDVVYRWQTVSNTIDDRLFTRMLLQPVSSQVKKGQKTMRATFIGMFLGSASSLMNVVNEGFPELGLTNKDCNEMSWIESVVYWANFDNTTSVNILLNRHSDTVNYLKRKSDYVQTPISKVALAGIWKEMLTLGKTGFVFNPYGGMMSQIAASATPFPHRAGNLFKIQYSVNWEDASVQSENNYVGQARTLYSYMAPYVSSSPRGAYLNYRDLDIGVTTNGNNSYNEGQVYGMKYFMGNFDRLVKVKTAVDPDNFFRNEQSIPTLPGTSQGK